MEKELSHYLDSGFLYQLSGFIMLRLQDYVLEF